MSSKRDYYEILGVGKNATDEEIKKAIRKLSLEFHPDRNKSKGAEDKFKEINEAYQVLSNPEKRQMYDQFGTADPQQAGPRGFQDQYIRASKLPSLHTSEPPGLRVPAANCLGGIREAQTISSTCPGMLQ